MKICFHFSFFDNFFGVQIPLNGLQITIVNTEAIKETFTISKMYSLLIYSVTFIGLGIKYTQKVINTLIKAITYGTKAIPFFIKAITYGAKAIPFFIKAITYRAKAIAYFIKVITYRAKAIAFKTISTAFSANITAIIMQVTTTSLLKESIVILISVYTIPFRYFLNVLKPFKSSFDFGKGVWHYNFYKLPKLFVHQARKDGITRVLQISLKTYPVIGFSSNI